MTEQHLREIHTTEEIRGKKILQSTFFNCVCGYRFTDGIFIFDYGNELTCPVCVRIWEIIIRKSDKKKCALEIAEST